MTVQAAYFDHSATTPLDERVLAPMLPYFSQSFGNPSSVHRWGQDAEAALTGARDSAAAMLQCRPDAISFSSGASESNNLGLVGIAERQRKQGKSRLISTPVEHPSVLNTLRWLEAERGFELTLLPVDSTGLVAPTSLEKSLDECTALVSIMYANNEVGTINPIADLGALCRRAGVPFHTDATQATCFLPMNIPDLNVDMLTLGAHKFYGPKGIGLLYVRPGLEPERLLHGGSQEHGIKPGTENIPLIVGLVQAMKLAFDERETSAARLRELRDAIITTVAREIPASALTGHPDLRLPNHASFAFEGIESNALLAALDLQGFACSAGSACKVGDPEPSRVLTAMGFDRKWALGSLRVSLGRSTTREQVERFCQILPEIISRVRSASAARVL
jgi:cysteine desulfurase